MAFYVFGAAPTQSAWVSYLSLDITASSLTLVWPDAYVDVPYTDPATNISYNSVANWMDVLTPLGNVNTITLPDATQTAPGTALIVNNVGQSSFLLLDASGDVDSPILNALPGIAYYVILVDNEQPVGIWRTTVFGAGSSEATPIDLAGLGLTPIGPTLNTNIPTVTANVVPTLDTTYRASFIIWTGGVATIPLPDISTVPDGFYLSFSNQGSATLTITPNVLNPAVTISGSPSVAVQRQQSLMIVCRKNPPNAPNWFTLGFGQNQFAVATVNALNVSPSIDVTLSDIQASSIIQEFNGVLTSDINVFFPVSANDWIISNDTTGNKTINVQLEGPIGDSYLIPQGTTQQFASDGSTIFPAQTGIQLVDGTPAIPAVSFLNSPGTGILRDNSNDRIIMTNSSNGFLEFGTLGIGSFITLFPPSITEVLIFAVTNVGADISYNGITALNISLTGQVSLPAGPLEITSGGTEATTQQGAINALMPTAIAPGDMVYWDGTDWVIVPAGTVNGQVLTWNAALAKPEWA